MTLTQAIAALPAAEARRRKANLSREMNARKRISDAARTFPNPFRAFATTADYVREFERSNHLKGTV